MPKIFPTLKDIFKKEIEKKIEPGEATGDLLNGLLAYFRGTFKQKINNYCENALTLYKTTGTDLPTDALFATIDSERVNLEKESDVRDEAHIHEDNVVLYKRIPVEWEAPKSTIESIIEGDQEVFNRLYEKEFPKFVRHVMANIGTIEEAADVFQDAIVLMIEISQNKRLIFFRGGIEKYLFEIAKRLWYEQLRRKKAVKELNDTLLKINGTEVEVELYPDTEKYIDILAEIDKLGKRCKELLYHFYYLNRDWKTITKELGYISEASARNQKYKCLQRIRKNLNNKG